MSKFYVGQRVRIVRCLLFPQFLGKETIVTELGPWETVQGNIATIRVDIPGPFGKGLVAQDDQVEPLTPSGHAPAELTVHELLPFLKTMADA